MEYLGNLILIIKNTINKNLEGKGEKENYNLKELI